jgi:hypothetical protein
MFPVGMWEISDVNIKKSVGTPVFSGLSTSELMYANSVRNMVVHGNSLSES